MVDDNQGIRVALKILLSSRFEQIELLPSPTTLLHTLETLKPDVVLLDMNFRASINSGGEGLFWLSEIKKNRPQTAVVLMTAYADIALAVEGMKRGATDFVVKPWDNDALIALLTSLCAERMSSPRRQDESGPTIYWGHSAPMLLIRKSLERVAPTDASVLVVGESGTGKELIARELHRLSRRSEGPLICVDGGAISTSLSEDELFGHVKGAFTDASSNRAGRFEQAQGGTLFLDEIANIPPSLQSKLLRVLQSRCITRVGGVDSISVDFRLVCATNGDIPSMIRSGLFREDLFYRLNTVQLHLPPLRERRDEILPLARLFLKEFAERYGRVVEDFSEEVLFRLESYDFPGNIRELRNYVERAVILSEGRVVKQLAIGEGISARISSAEGTLDTMEEQAIRSAMIRYSGNISAVSKSLGISRPTLYSKLKRYGIL